MPGVFLPKHMPGGNLFWNQTIIHHFQFSTGNNIHQLKTWAQPYFPKQMREEIFFKLSITPIFDKWKIHWWKNSLLPTSPCPVYFYLLVAKKSNNYPPLQSSLHGWKTEWPHPNFFGSIPLRSKKGNWKLWWFASRKGELGATKWHIHLLRLNCQFLVVFLDFYKIILG